jgi:hypothetical protein
VEYHESVSFILLPFSSVGFTPYRRLAREREEGRRFNVYEAVNESRVSEIVHYHIHKLTLDRLVKYLEKIKPKAEVKVA